MLYHKRGYWNKQIENEAICFIKRWHGKPSQHLSYIIMSKTRRNHIYSIGEIYKAIGHAKLNNCYIFETAYKKEKLTKVVFRTSFNDYDDISIVLSNGIIVTAWLNRKTDNHETLNLNNYCC